MTPEGWRAVTLADVVTRDGLQTGPFGAQLHASDYTHEGIPVVMPKDLAGGRIVVDSIARVPESLAAQLHRHRVRAGDLLFGRRGDIGRCGLVLDAESGWLCGTGCLRARLDTTSVAPAFVTHQITWEPSVKWLTEHAVGQTMLNLNTSILGALPLRLPPIREQKKIAAILSSIDDVIASTHAVIDQLGVLKKSMMSELLTRGIPGRHTEFKETAAGNIPRDWDVMSLEAVCGTDGLQTGPFGSQLKASEYTEAGVPVVMPKDLRDGAISTDTVARVSEARATTLAQHRVRVGDVLFGRRGDIGRCALVREGQKGWLCGTGCLRARPVVSIHSEYLLVWLSSQIPVSWLQERAVGQTMLNLNTTILGSVPVAIPPLDEQQTIAGAITSVSARLTQERRHLEGLQALKPALMSVLLTGEVRVKPDEVAT